MQFRSETASIDNSIFEMAVNQAAEAIVITNFDGTIIYVNPAFERISGYTADEAMGSTPRILKSGLHKPDFYKELWSIINSGGTWNGEFINRKKTGEIYYERGSISPVYEDDQIRYFIAVKQDITHEKIHMKEKEELFQEIAASEMTTKEALRQAEERNITSTRFISCFIDEGEKLVIKLSQTIDPILFDKYPKNEPIGLLHRIIFSLKKSIFNARCWQQLQDGALLFEEHPFDLNELILDITEEITREAVRKGITIDMDISPDIAPFLTGDENNLKIIMQTILDNAIKYTSNGGVRIKISSETGIAPGHIFLNVNIIDTGCGIPLENIKDVFTPFFRISNEAPGLGLGLPLAEMLISRLNGDISIESVQGDGTSVKLLFPMRETDEESMIPDISISQAMKTVGRDKILLGELLTMLCVNGATSTQTIIEDLQSNDIRHALSLCLTLASNAETLGANGIARSARKLEECLSENTEKKQEDQILYSLKLQNEIAIMARWLKREY